MELTYNDNKKINNKYKIEEYLLLFVYIVSAFSKTNEYISGAISITLILVTFYFFNKNNFFSLFPLFIFYSQFFTIFQGIRVFDLYALLLIVKIVFSKKMKINKRLLIPVSIVILHMIVIAPYYEISVAFNTVIMTTTIFLYISNFLNNDSNITVFLKFFVYATLSASMYSLINYINMNTYYIIVSGVATAINRNTGTFIDPNYFGFFLNCAILTMLTTKKIELGKIIKVIIIIALYISLVSTLSLTGIIYNIILVLIYIIINDKDRFRTVLFIVTIILALLLAFSVLKKFDIKLLNNLILRLENIKILDNNIDAATSNRTIIWRAHYTYFKDQSIWKIFLGGNFITDYGFSSMFKTVSHQTFIDMLLNYGIIGTGILIYGYLINIVRLFKRTCDNNKHTVILIKITWFMYAFSLSMFPSWIFLIFFLF